MPLALATSIGILIGLCITLGLAIICLVLGVTAIPGHVEPGQENQLVNISSIFVNLALYLFYSSFVVTPIMGFLGYRYARRKQALEQPTEAEE